MACNTSNDAKPDSADGTDATDSKAVLDQCQPVIEYEGGYPHNYDGGATYMVTRLTPMGNFPFSSAKSTCVMPSDVLLGE